MAKEEILEMTSINTAPEIELSGESLVDLVSVPMFGNNPTDIQDIKIVSRSLAGKPVSIMKAIYKTSKNMDLFFSVNGYSNPLTVKEGDVLIVPTQEAMSANVGRNNRENIAIQELKKRVSKVDQNRLKFLRAGEIKQPNQNPTRKQFTKKPNRTISLGAQNNENDANIEIRNRVLNKINTKNK